MSVKCTNCSSENVVIAYCEDGEISHVTCNVCQHREPYYHITERGKEILRILLDSDSLQLTGEKYE